MNYIQKLLFYTLFIICTVSMLPGMAQKNKLKDKLKKDKENRAVIENDTIRYQKLDYDTTTYEKGEEVELTNAEKLIVIHDSLTKLIGNVVFKQGKVHLYCDSAYKYAKTNIVEAFGHVRLIQDSLTLNCNKLYYIGDERLIQARDKVVLRDPKMTLNTDFLDYSLNSKIGYYYGGGRIVDSQNNLTSKSGSYDTQAKFFFFKDDVKVLGRNKGSNYRIESDTLQYNEISKVAYFKGPTRIHSDEGNIYAEKGNYSTTTQISNFSGRSVVENTKYILKGDSLYYNEGKVEGYAKGNAEIFVKEDSIFINGKEGRFWGAKGLTKMYGDAYMRNINRGDTLFLSADSLISYNKKILPKNQQSKASSEKTTIEDSIALAKEKRMMLAFNRVKIYRSDMQGKCDSLVYNFKDSTIYLFKDPVLWNEGNQMSGDSIRILMANNQLHHLEMRVNCFIISEDSVKNFNQLKGRSVDGFFKENKISHVIADGNAESIQFVLDDEDKSLTGMLRLVGSSIKGYFEDNKLSKVGYYNNVDGKFIPPHELKDPDKTLTGFLWRIDEKPTRQTVLIRNKETIEKVQNNKEKDQKLNNSKTKLDIEKSKLLKEDL